MKLINLVIADDHVVLRQGLISLLQEFEQINILFDVSNGQELLNELKNSHPDVILLDIEMPVMGGKEALKQIRSLYPEIKVIILSMHYTDSYINEFLTLGAKGFLPKETDIYEIIKAINTVYENEYYFDDKISKTLLMKLKETSGQINNQSIVFTQQERKVIRLYCTGKSCENIADVLFISKRTVEWHKENIYKKAEVKNLVELIKYALKNHIITEKEILL